MTRRAILSERLSNAGRFLLDELHLNDPLVIAIKMLGYSFLLFEVYKSFLIILQSMLIYLIIYLTL